MVKLHDAKLTEIEQAAHDALVDAAKAVLKTAKTLVPVGSMVAYWGGRERRVIAAERHEAPGWPAYQTLYLE